MLEQLSNAELLEAWKHGRERAATVLVNRYIGRLMQLARTRLSRKLVGRVDADDVVMSAWRSFFGAARCDQVHPPADDNLWPLLAKITVRKIYKTVKREQAECRTVAREARGDDEEWIDQVASREATPEDAAIVADEIECLLSQLDDRERDIVSRRLGCDDPAAIAAACRCSTRTVSRALECARNIIAARGRDNERSVGANAKRWPTNVTSAPSLSHIEPSWQDRASNEICYRDLILERFIGEGGFGKVYRAFDRQTGGTVAVKFLKRQWWTDRRAISALLQEGSALGLFADQRIVGWRGWGRTPHGAVFLVLEWIEGEDLAIWRKRQQPSADECASIGTTVADTLAGVHARGLVHGDLKPANVIRTQDGRLVLSDFGLAHFVNQPGLSRAFGGTAGYLAPEQLTDAYGPVTPLTDVYGLGGLMYSLWAGVPPFTGQDVPEILAQVLSSRRVARLDRLTPHVSKSFADIVARCLEKAPRDRYQNMDAVIAAMAQEFPQLT